MLQSLINNISKLKDQAQLCSLVKYTKYLRKKFLPFSYNLFQKTEAEVIIPKSFYEPASITLIPQPKSLQEKYRPISFTYLDVKSSHMIGKLNPKDV